MYFGVFDVFCIINCYLTCFYENQYSIVFCIYEHIGKYNSGLFEIHEQIMFYLLNKGFFLSRVVAQVFSEGLFLQKL